jgi:hypothetical protein
MNLKQDRIKEIVDNGYALDFADVFNKAFEKKNSALCGLMIFVFMVILILIIVSVGISFLGLGALSQESMKELSLNMENLNGINLINYTGYQFSLLISPLQAGLIKWLIVQKEMRSFMFQPFFSYYTSISLKFYCNISNLGVCNIWYI